MMAGILEAETLKEREVKLRITEVVRKSSIASDFWSIKLKKLIFFKITEKTYLIVL